MDSDTRRRRTTYIAKPRGGCQGKGISLIQDYKNIKAGQVRAARAPRKHQRQRTRTVQKKH